MTKQHHYIYFTTIKKKKLGDQLKIADIKTMILEYPSKSDNLVVPDL